MVIKLKGILDFNSQDVTAKQISQSSWKKFAMIRTDCEMDRYYSWFLKKRFGLELNTNLRGSHITIINDRISVENFENAKRIFDGKEITFYIDIEPRSSVDHWWLRVYSPEAESIREILGLTRNPFFDFHLTLGHAVVKYPETEYDKRVYEIRGELYRTSNKEDIERLEQELITLKENELPIPRAKKDYIDHSKYILNSCIRHNIISNSARKPLSEHEVLDFTKES